MTEAILQTPSVHGRNLVRIPGWPAYFEGMSQPLPLLTLTDEAVPIGATSALPCVLDLDLPALQAVLAELGQPAYRARQVYKALHSRLVGSWDAMTDLPAGLRSALAER